ncbi:MAG: T9SS type A sorting domain-containing protein [Calditrichaeota bacterium]|nr:T9SS type A sorting domain-containing protein [Calditrichota bacterium]
MSISRLLWIFGGMVGWFPFIIHAQFLDTFIPDYRVNGLTGQVKQIYYSPRVVTNNQLAVVTWKEWDYYQYTIRGKQILPRGNSSTETILFVPPDGRKTIFYYETDINRRNQIVIGYVRGEREQASSRFIATIFIQLFNESGQKIRDLLQLDLPGLLYGFDVQFITDTTLVYLYYTGQTFFQVLDVYGQPLTPLLSLSGAVGRGYRIPALSINSNGDLYFANLGSTQGRNSIYYQKFVRSTGEFDPLVLVSPFEGRYFVAIDIAHDRNNNFVIVWREDNFLKGRYFTADGQSPDSVFLLGEWLFEPDLDKMEVEFDTSGHFYFTTDVVYWSQNGPAVGVILQKVNPLSGEILFEKLLIDTINTDNRHYSPNLAVFPDGVLITRLAGLGVLSQVVLSRMDTEGQYLMEDWQVSDDTLSAAPQYLPVATMDGLGRILVAWVDERDWTPSIFARFLTAEGTALGNEFELRGEPSGKADKLVRVAVNSQGDWAVLWQERTYAEVLIWLAIITGHPTNPEITKVRLDIDEWMDANFQLIGLADQGFAVLWNGENMGNVNALIISREGETLKRLQPILDPPGKIVLLGSLYNNQVTLLTYDFGNDSSMFVLRYFDDQFQPVGEKIVLHDPVRIILGQGIPGIIGNSKGDILVAWIDQDSVLAPSAIYAKLISHGSIQDSLIFQLPDGIQFDFHKKISLAMDDDRNWVASWQQVNTNGSRIFAQRFQRFSQPLDTVFQIPRNDKFDQKDIYMLLRQDQLISFWSQLSDLHTGWDIWSNVLDVNSEITNIVRSNEAYNRTVTLIKNYPNPFNSGTTIVYRLSKAAKVEIEIFNLLGQRVRKLVRAQQPAGEYRVFWNGRDDRGKAVSSGIYVYRFQAGEFVHIRKMLLVK